MPLRGKTCHHADMHVDDKKKLIPQAILCENSKITFLWRDLVPICRRHGR